MLGNNVCFGNSDKNDRGKAMSINESILEQVIISELQQKGYNYLYGPDISRDYHEVILQENFEDTLYKINHTINAEIISESYRIIKNLGMLKLEDMNAAFHRYLTQTSHTAWCVEP